VNYLGIDYGEKRIGLSHGDELGLAMPMQAATQAKKKERLQYIGEIIQTRKINELVIGYPVNMDGTKGFKAQEVDEFIGELEVRFKLKIHRMDERLTSKQAINDMYAAGEKMPKSIKEQKDFRATGKIDSRSAAIILQDFLDMTYNTQL
jgi:putative holliday junction resolvase